MSIEVQATVKIIENYIYVYNNEVECMEHFVVYLLGVIEHLAKNKEIITIGLSGASLVGYLSKEWIKQKSKLPQTVWKKLRFLFCDERFVPLDHEDSTYFGYKKAHLFDELNLGEENVLHIDANASSVEECAVEYEKRLRPLLNPTTQGFDILIFGTGPDGHTCSLFPGHPLFTNPDEKRLVAPISDSPKPPPKRVTLTLDWINNASYLLNFSYGEGKAPILKRVLGDKDKSLPSTLVVPKSSNGTLKWFIDKAAASLL